MDKLIQVLNDVDADAVEQEVRDKKPKNSASLNAALQANYQIPAAAKSSKQMLLAIWGQMVDGAQVPRNPETISPMWFAAFAALDRIIKAMYDNQSTAEALLTALRKPLKLKYGANSAIYRESIYKTGMSREASIARRQEYEDKVAERNSTRGKLDPIYVEDILDIISQLKQSTNPFEQVLAITLATGARNIEALKVSEFKEAADPHQIRIRGLAKGKAGTESVEITRNLVGLTGAEVVALVNGYRPQLKLAGSNVVVGSRYTDDINRAFQRWVQPLNPKVHMTSHKARYIQANASFLLYGQPFDLPYESYLTQQLGHNTPSATKSYLGINVKFKSKVLQNAPEDFRHLFEKELAELRSQIKTANPPDEIPLDLTQFKNGNTRGKDSEEKKIARVFAALKALHEADVYVRQNVLRGELGYSSRIMTAAYRVAREHGLPV